MDLPGNMRLVDQLVANVNNKSILLVLCCGFFLIINVSSNSKWENV